MRAGAIDISGQECCCARSESQQEPTERFALTPTYSTSINTRPFSTKVL